MGRAERGAPGHTPQPSPSCIPRRLLIGFLCSLRVLWLVRTGAPGASSAGLIAPTSSAHPLPPIAAPASFPSSGRSSPVPPVGQRPLCGLPATALLLCSTHTLARTSILPTLPRFLHCPQARPICLQVPPPGVPVSRCPVLQPLPPPHLFPILPVLRPCSRWVLSSPAQPQSPVEQLSSCWASSALGIGPISLGCPLAQVWVRLLSPGFFPPSNILFPSGRALDSLPLPLPSSQPSTEGRIPPSTSCLLPTPAFHSAPRLQLRAHH